VKLPGAPVVVVVVVVVVVPPPPPHGAPILQPTGQDTSIPLSTHTGVEYDEIWSTHIMYVYVPSPLLVDNCASTDSVTTSPVEHFLYLTSLPETLAGSSVNVKLLQVGATVVVVVVVGASVVVVVVVVVGASVVVVVVVVVVGIPLIFNVSALVHVPVEVIVT
jgi:hypothetical protein